MQVRGSFVVTIAIKLDSHYFCLLLQRTSFPKKKSCLEWLETSILIYFVLVSDFECEVSCNMHLKNRQRNKTQKNPRKLFNCRLPMAFFYKPKNKKQTQKMKPTCLAFMTVACLLAFSLYFYDTIKILNSRNKFTEIFFFMSMSRSRGLNEEKFSLSVWNNFWRSKTSSWSLDKVAAFFVCFLLMNYNFKMFSFSRISLNYEQF